MTVWFTGDWHAGHRNILALANRPFDTIEEHDHTLVDNINKVVKRGDTLVVVGDAALSANKLFPFRDIVCRDVWLVAGNHDECFDGLPRAERGYRRYREAGVFDTITTSGTVENFALPNGQLVNLSHFPYTEDHKERARWTAHRPFDNGLPLVCGHMHTAWRERGRQLNVGVDQWEFAPVHEQDVMDWVASLG